MAGIAGRHSRQAGAIAPPFFLRLISSETSRGPPPATQPKRTGQHAPRRTAHQPPDKSPGQIPDPPGQQPDTPDHALPNTQPAGKTGPLPNQFLRRTLMPEPRTADTGPAKTARGPWISGHRHRPKNGAARPNFRGPRRCGTSACAMFRANNYVKNGISSDLLVN